MRLCTIQCQLVSHNANPYPSHHSIMGRGAMFDVNLEALRLTGVVITYGPRLELADFFRILNLNWMLVVQCFFWGVFKNWPPGAVGAWYGSGCFHFSNKSSVSWNNAYSQINWLHWHAVRVMRTYPLLSRVLNVFIGLEERPDVHRLAPPKVSMNSPVERKLQWPSIKRPAIVIRSWTLNSWRWDIRYCLSGGHIWSLPFPRQCRQFSTISCIPQG